MPSTQWAPPWDHMRTVESAARTITHCGCHGTGFMRVPAPVGHPLFGKAIPCICKQDQMARRKAQDLMRWSGVDEQMLSENTFANFYPERSCIKEGVDPQEGIAMMERIEKACRSYAREPEGWLHLLGTVGSGKTHLATAIANKALKTGKQVHMNSVARLMDLLRSSYQDNMYETWWSKLNAMELLILDDFGAQRDTEWAVEKLFQLIDERYRQRRPLVITSNMPLGEYDGAVDRRILSRLMEGTKADDGWCRVLRLPADDFRPFNRRR